MSEDIKGCRGTIGISDDIAVYRKTPEEHDQNVRQNKIKLYEQICSDKGVPPDQAKILALKMAPQQIHKSFKRSTVSQHTWDGSYQISVPRQHLWKKL